jgi:hypothetical protein
MTLEDFHEETTVGPVYERAASLVEDGFMPYPDSSLTPPVEPLTPAEKTLLLDWLNAGAPSVLGDPACP